MIPGRCCLFTNGHATAPYCMHADSARTPPILIELLPHWLAPGHAGLPLTKVDAREVLWVLMRLVDHLRQLAALQGQPASKQARRGRGTLWSACMGYNLWNNTRSIKAGAGHGLVLRPCP